MRSKLIYDRYNNAIQIICIDCVEMRYRNIQTSTYIREYMYFSHISLNSHSFYMIQTHFLSLYSCVQEFVYLIAEKGNCELP